MSERIERCPIHRSRIVLTGAAGLVGQNLVPRLKTHGFDNIVAIDKHSVNIKILSELHPDTHVVHADLTRDGAWTEAFAGADTLIQCHAQIGGTDPRAFEANNVTATKRVLAAAKAAGIAYIVHISSSVVNSAAVDAYTESKKAQEALVASCGIPGVVLRPTLLFGWFDRKHLGWLARFMARVPIFPIPGSGLYPRQPLYAGDFCNIIMACLERRVTGTAFNISGLEKIDYIDIIRQVRDASGLKTPLVHIPYYLFWAMLKVYSLINSEPPFTTKQLEALVMPDLFEVIDWPRIFGVSATPLYEALHQTLHHPRYSKIVLEF
jgi:nucleoside-diphosphate-sugar epimerase